MQRLTCVGAFAAACVLPAPWSHAQCDPEELAEIAGVVADAEFGTAVALWGDTAVIGASRENDQAGAAYVFEDIDGVWTQVQRLTASDAMPDGLFGYDAAIYEDTIIIGALSNIDTDVPGSAYVFVRDDRGVWSETQKLIADDGGEYGYGRRVAVFGDVAMVGSANQPTGEVYVFEADEAGVWEQTQVLVGAGANGAFGAAIAIDGDTAIVSRPNFLGPGSAHVFERIDGAWSEVQVLVGDGGFDEFGTSVDVQGDTAIVGATDFNFGQGTAHVFERGDAGDWSEAAQLFASDGVFGDDFGWSVSAWGDVVLVGAPKAGSFEGAVYVHERDKAGNWPHVATLVGNAMPGDRVGHAAALHGDTAIVGAIFADGLNGLAFIYDLHCEPSCFADFDGDGELTILDFVAFQDAFSAQDAEADCDQNGTLDILDFLCFQEAFQGGC